MTTGQKRKVESLTPTTLTIEPALKKARLDVDAMEKLDQMLVNMLFPPLPKPEPFALMTPGNDTIQSLLKTHFLESKTLEIKLVDGQYVPLNTIAEIRNAQVEKRAPVNVDVSSKLEIFTIPPSDPRVALRGERGIRVRAGQRVSAKDCLFWYGGLLTHTVVPIAGTGRRWLSDAYGFDTHAVDANGHHLTITALEQHGNMSKYVNDCRLTIDSQDIRRVNAAWGEVCVNGHVPLVFMFALADLAEGTEVLIDYGQQYWALYQERLAAHERVCAEAVAMRSLIASCRPPLT